MSHYEILLRMLGEDGKQVIPPASFMPAAEHYHLMPSIDRWVIEHTLNMLTRELVGHAEIPCRVSINLSGQSLSDLDLQQFIIDKLECSKISTEHICFEVTESAAIANLEEAKHFITAIKQKGCRFSLDDFGTGLSSFSYLKNLDVDYLKIDGSFVRDIDKDPIARTMVSAINQVGHAMGLQTIAEYVENETIRDHLQLMQVDFGQGYALGKPEAVSGYPRHHDSAKQGHLWLRWNSSSRPTARCTIEDGAIHQHRPCRRQIPECKPLMGSSFSYDLVCRY